MSTVCNSLGTGTTKRKELHGSACIRSLYGKWADDVDINFHAYKFEFFSSITSEIYSNFVLLLESKLDDDVGNIELDLYLVNKVVKTAVSPHGMLFLDAAQIAKAKCFQELFFNGLFGKLFTGSKRSGTERKFLLGKNSTSLWNSKYMYLLLPIERHETLTINWTVVSACATIVANLSEAQISFPKSSTGNGQSGVHNLILPAAECRNGNKIILANMSADMNSLKDLVVMACHTGRLYSILEAVNGSSADSPFDGNIDGVHSDYSTFAEYFKKKYNIDLLHPKQPLLKLKQSHCAHNLLVDFTDQGGSKPRQFVHIPPELLLSLDTPFHVMKASYLLPSLMHRLESLMLASQLREEIGIGNPDTIIPSSLILEAITTPRCCESFSLERLELFGDSVLKYTASCHLFLLYPNQHEGQLSSLRSEMVCNSKLHALGTGRQLQGYIRDSAFDPRRWVAPGQRTVHPFPCSCGVDTSDVPVDEKFVTEDSKVLKARSCDLGHRWMNSKSIADCVESIIGAYFVGGGMVSALHVIRWFGVNFETDIALMDEAIKSMSLKCYVPKEDEIKILESKIRYTFNQKFLIQEAITHESSIEQGIHCCYQRLEFLGDSVLDLLITRYLYGCHKDLDPGELTSLRGASVSNCNFAQIAVRKDLYCHLQHCSTILRDQISEYVDYLSSSDKHNISVQSRTAPKVLGDIFESIAGAVLLDTRLNLDEVWRVFEPLLSPIVTPEELALHPTQQLIELCDSLGYFTKEKYVFKGETMHCEVTVQLRDILLAGNGSDKNKKTAKAKAALVLLEELKKRGIQRHPGIVKHKTVEPEDSVSAAPSSTIEDLAPHSKRHKVENLQILYLHVAESAKSSPVHTSSVIQGISLKKGGPRTALYNLCKKHQWPMPTFDTIQETLSTPKEFGEGEEKRLGQISFVSRITLNMPSSDAIECIGTARADKKSSFDSAALVLLHELHAQGRLPDID